MTVREPIAVLGMGCRFPGAEGVDAYWALLLRGEDAVGEVPPDRWDADALWSDDAAAAGRAHCRWGGFIDGGDAFDAALFGISAHEAERMDPQQGLALELAWEALEHAGISPHGLGGSDTGVFVGVSTSDFDRALCRDLANLDLRAGTGTSYSVVANRLSYSLGLCGPSVAVDLACASSLAAVHLACQALWLGECDLALAGGVHLILSPEKTVTFSQGGVLARDGRCKAFSAAADGYVRGEGGGMVVLKRWADAERDQDPIWALIRGSALNHNGGSNGLSAPLGAAQERVLRRALAVGGVSPATIGFVEAHGTGTLIGDAIEIKALKAVLSEGRSKDQVCMIGSVKTNIGHLEAASGIAGLIKAVLTTSHGVIPPTLHAAPVSKHLRLDGTPFRIAESTTPWPDRVAPRQAAVSSFSFGGGNAHVVIEEAPKRPESATTAPRDCLLALSARTPAALAALARRYEAHLMALASRSDAAAFADTCFTAAVGRAHFPHRLAILADGPEAAAAALRAFVEGGEHPRLFVDEAPPRRRSSLAYL